MPPVVPPRLAYVLHAWRSVVSPHRRAAVAGSVMLLAVLAAHAARVGTLPWRLSAALGLAVLAVAWSMRAVWEWRAWRDPGRAAHAALSAVDPELADRTARAAALVTEPDTLADPLSWGLAQLHLERVVTSIGRDRLAAAAQRRGAHWQRAALAMLAVALAVLAAAPLRFLEGVDVMLARHGHAPFALDWVDAVVGEVQVPRYLRQRDQLFIGMQPTSHPRGSVITVRARALHDGRHLVLTDGTTEVGFTDDGRGGMLCFAQVVDSRSARDRASRGLVLQGPHARSERQ